MHVRLFTLLFGLVLAAGCAPPAGPATAPPKGGQAVAGVPSSLLRTVTGQTLRISDHVGRDVVLVSFWATWCKPCRAEFPLLQRLHEQYAAEGLTVIAVSVDGPESEAEVRPFLRSNGYTMPAIIDRDGRVAAALNPRAAVPMGILFGRDGSRQRTFEGFQLGERSHLEDAVRSLLDLPSEEGQE